MSHPWRYSIREEKASLPIWGKLADIAPQFQPFLGDFFDRPNRQSYTIIRESP